MELPSLLCRVQALYSFESNDPSSLRFEQGDFIDVLAKLPSGWWDGWCNGNRGWFPSNYVKIIQDYHHGSTSLVSPTKDLFDDRVGSTSSLPPNWSIQNNEDGSTSYYFNTITGEMRSTYPYENEVVYDLESDEDSATSTIESNPRSDSLLDGAFLATTAATTSTEELSESGAAPNKWIQRNTAQGLPFFYNLSTQEASWHADSTTQENAQLNHPSRPKSSPLFSPQEQVTWNKLSIHVSFSINNLIASAKTSQRSLYKKYAASVVESVRFMLVASGTISKESLYIKTSAVLRSHHRTMMASLSKLVLSCQLCADSTVTDVTKLLSDCHELLIAVRNFISTCESIPVKISHVDPMFLDEVDTYVKRNSSMSTARASKYELSQDLLENLNAYGSAMKESIESLMSNLTRHSDSRCSLAVSLFTQYRNFGNQNGQFLAVIEDIDFDGLGPLKELTLAKQKLYDGLGLLFFKMQIMTNESIPMDLLVTEMQQVSKSIMEAIQSILDQVKLLVKEKYKDESLSLSSGKRSKSLTEETLTNTPKLVHNRSSAPVIQQQSDDNSSTSSIDLKHRSHTFTDTKHTSAKLKQFFGDEVPPSSSTTTAPTSPTTDVTMLARKSTNNSSTGLTHDLVQQQIQPEQERYLQYDYNPSEIVFTIDGNVKGGTLAALVERMTLHDYLDMNFNSTFLLTYRSFCTSMEVLQLLEARYSIQPPNDLTPEELEIWVTKKQKLIRLRVFNVLKIWLEQYYYEEDSVILDRLLSFTNTSIRETLSFSAYQLEKLIHKRKEAVRDLKKLVITQQPDCPDPILPRNLKKFRLLDLDATEMARQLTIMDFKLYSSIKPVECLDKSWSKDANASDARTPVAANIQASIDYCNQVTTWISDEILSQSEVKKRSTLIKYWVSVAEKCRLLNNFNTCMAVLSAFDNSAVGRLKRTWEMVGARANHTVANIRKLMGANRNFTQYRALIHSVNPPCIPFLGIYLQDLTFIEDGNPNFLKTSKDLINFAKRAKTAEVIREIQQYQSMGYHFRPVEEIQNFIMENLHSSRDEDQLYKESLKLEPKERDDEKITRLLQESGFL